MKNLKSLLTSVVFLLFINGYAVNVTFQVDMSQQTVPPEGVHIAGSFQGWDPGATLMTDIGNNIYSYSQDFTGGDYIEYKFVNGDEWGEDESVPAACAQNNNRFLTVPVADTVLIAVCFGSCNPCGDPVNITFQIDMSEQTVSPNGVHIAGSFQGWNPGTTQMTNIGDDIFAVTVTLSAGEYVEFKYINGTDWPGVEQVPPACGVPDGMGGYNRYLDVPSVDSTLTALCFGSCYPCGYVPVEIDITFRVDMSEDTVSADGIHITGSFQGWDPAATEMTLTGNNIYTVTLTLLSSEYHEYKFVNGNTWDGAEQVPEECGTDDGQGGFNRFITVPEVDSTLTAICFGSCDPCTVGIDPDEESSGAVHFTKISPNPFTGEINIEYVIPEKAFVRLSVLDLFGKTVAVIINEEMECGTFTQQFHADALPKGIYFCKMEVRNNKSFFTETKKIIKH
ncbi:MAG: T9SS type A sorting domain-containing protein [Bacteroidetes bacterium]|nr:T9SS type A sorting domain-containing protein [Bacteroidota bacterium]MBL7104989.1 T9SS type A sorting domain-containing protein [Bacteroidales bacterium]